MATEYSKNVDENSRHRDADYKGRQFVTPIARATQSDCTHTGIVSSSLICKPLYKNTVFLSVQSQPFSQRMS